MPYTLKSNRAKFRNANGEYKEFDLISENSTAEQIAAIEAKGAQTRASIPADYTALSDNVESKIGNISDNLFEGYYDPRIVVGQYYTNTGDTASSSSWATVKMDISGFDTIEYDGLTSGGGDSVVSCWFKDDDTFIGYFKQAIGTNRVNVPSLAKYVGFSINRSETVYNNFAVYGIITGTINEKIEDIFEILDENPVPNYFKTQLATKETNIISNMNECGANGETFVFITDPHWETNYKNSPSLVSHILKHTKVNQIYCGGDIINESTNQTLMQKTIIDFIRRFQFGLSNFFLPIARGNHDDNSNWSSSADVEAYSFDYNTVFALLYKDISEQVTFLRLGTDFSFYFDRKSTKTRYIFYDTKRNGTYSATNALIDLLQNTPEDYNIIFIAHYLYDGTNFKSGAMLLFNMISAFNGKTSGSYGGASFDFTTANGKVICVIAGHTHADYQWTKNDANNISGVPIIITDTDSYRNQAAIEGTTDSQCFDVITIDYNAKKIKCIRIGRGSDRTFDFN